jgi:hypothetical protein
MLSKPANNFFTHLSKRNSLTGLCTNKTLKLNDLSHQAGGETIAAF